MESPTWSNCGWGGDTGGGGSNLNRSSSETEITSGAQTSRIKCWWCGEEVFYHTNNTDSTKQRFFLLTSYVQRFRFAPYEYSIAREMGISEEQLKASYGDLYYLDDTHALKLYSLSEAVRLKRIFEIRREFNQQFKQHKLKSDKGAKQQIIEIRKQKQLEDTPTIK